MNDIRDSLASITGCRMSEAVNPYGDGRASEGLGRIIMERLG